MLSQSRSAEKTTTGQLSGGLRTKADVNRERLYRTLYQESIEQPETFWGRQATELLAWHRPWHTVLQYNPAVLGNSNEPFVTWFDGGQLNVTVNCLDRHIKNGRGKHPALIWQGDDEKQERVLTYQELLIEVSRLANVLKKYGVARGDVVTIYLPMIPEAVIAMLACARIGAVHSVVFSAFSSQALAQRIQDAKSKLVITADVGFHRGNIIPLKKKTGEAVASCPSVARIIVAKHGNHEVAMHPTRDIFWQDAVAKADISEHCKPVIMAAEDDLFILYTSGSTGKPKAIRHTTAGYLLQAHLTFKWLFDIRQNDIHYCTADVGWITGHSYVVYGPLSNGVTSVIFEGAPTCPTPDRFWKIIARHRVSIFYTAPTAIRTLMQFGAAPVQQHDLTSLRVLGSVGEPINEQAWQWYWQVIGGKKCPVLDTWWQTETGAIMIAPFVGAAALLPGSATKPFFGIQPEVIRPDGRAAAVNEAGSLVIKKPWPSMLRGIHGDDRHRFLKKHYFSQSSDKYITGDGARRDSNGNFWLLGRTDDVINVSAHRFSSAELEQALTAHQDVIEAAVIGIPDSIKGEVICCFVTPVNVTSDAALLAPLLITHLRTVIGPIATPAHMYIVTNLPKTRSGKIMRRILRAVATGQIAELGDTSTLADQDVVASLIAAVAQQP